MKKRKKDVTMRPGKGSALARMLLVYLMSLPPLLKYITALHEDNIFPAFTENTNKVLSNITSLSAAN